VALHLTELAELNGAELSSFQIFMVKVENFTGKKGGELG